MHRSRSDTVANANANSDAPRKFASEFSPLNLKQEAANEALRRNSLANANDFANDKLACLNGFRNYLKLLGLTPPNLFR